MTLSYSPTSVLVFQFIIMLPLKIFMSISVNCVFSIIMMIAWNFTLTCFSGLRNAEKVSAVRRLTV